jgi:hypothetical protein
MPEPSIQHVAEAPMATSPYACPTTHTLPVLALHSTFLTIQEHNPSIPTPPQLPKSRHPTACTIKNSEFTLYQTVTETIRKQILEAINPTFYDVLEDDTFGYAGVTILQLLNHINSEYGKMTRTDLEINRNLLKAALNPDDEFATLWTHIKTVRQIASDGGDPISDNTTMELTLQALREAGVYGHALQTWDDKPE